MLPCPVAGSRPERPVSPMSESISQPTALRTPGPRAAALRRRELHRRLVAGGLWLFFLGNLAAILYITLFSSSGDALDYHWSSFDNVLLGVGRLTAFLAGYFALIEVILLARVPFLERLAGLRQADDLAPLDRPRRHLPGADPRRLHRLGVRQAGRLQLVRRVLALAHAAAAAGARVVLARRAARRRRA